MYGTGEMKGSEKMNISSVVAGRDAAKVFELVEAALDAIAEPIGSGVVANDGDPCALGRDHSLCAQAGDKATKSIAVIASVGDDPPGGLPFEQCMRLREIVRLTGCEEKPKRPAECIRQEMDFSGQSSSGAPQSLILAPPFPVAAC